MNTDSWTSVFRASSGLLVLGLLLCGCATEASQKRQPTVQQITSAQTRAEHEDLAVWYEQEARAAKEKADRHRRMLNDSYRPAYGSRYTGTYRERAFLRHCENLVRRYGEVAEDTLALAKLHRQLATETKE